MHQAANQKANTGNPVTVFEKLRKEHQLRLIRRKGAALRSKPLINIDLITRFLTYYHAAEKFTWKNQPWYQGTGLHYSINCEITPFAKQVCGGGYDNVDYQNTMLFDLPINNQLFDDMEIFPLVRCKVTGILGNYQGGGSNENFLWHRDERPHEVLRVIIPLQTSQEYQFQLDNCKPVVLETGMVYAFDQSVWHRIYKKSTTSIDRIHLVLSYVTWFDKTGKHWLPNQYAGNVHPLDLFEQINL